MAEKDEGTAAAGGKPAKKRKPPKVGEPVQFLPGGAASVHVPATVTKVNEDGSCDLHVLRPEFNSTDWPIAVKEGDAKGEFRRLEDA